MNDARQRGHTLGRNGVETGGDRLYSVLKRLDALLCVISSTVTGESFNDFQQFNGHIQRAVLDLAQDLAQEAHELHADLLFGDGGSK